MDRGDEGAAQRRGAMKITAVRPFVVDGGGRNYFYVEVETNEGVYGIGEAGVGAGGGGARDSARRGGVLAATAPLVWMS